MSDKRLCAISQAKRCLIIAPSWVGDMVMAQVLLRELKRSSPDLVIDVLAPKWCAGLTQFMSEVNQHIDAPFAHGELALKQRWQLAKELRGKYDMAVVLPNSLKSALVPWMANIPNRIGFLGEQRYGVLNHWQKLDKKMLPTMCQRFAALGRAIEDTPEISDILAPTFSIPFSDKTQVLNTHNIVANDNKKIIALFPGAEFGASKQWPTEHYGAVARYFLDKGCDVWLFGSENDQETCAQINKNSQNRCINLAGETTLVDAVKLISYVDLAITNDSGLMHVAAALGKPVIAIYGSTDPSFTPPMHPAAQVVRLELECSPCFKRDCPLKHLDCLKQLHPNKVLKSAQQALDLAGAN